MARTYNDAEKIIATELAYLDLNMDPWAEYTLGEVIRNYKKIDENGNLVFCEDTPDKIKNKIENIEKLMNDCGLQECNNWKVAYTCPDNNNSGYFGALIDTGDGGAIITSRGSEGGIQNAFSDPEAFKDWVATDLMFLNNPGTTSQEIKAQEFMQDIWYQFGDQYDYTITGHSLGGHLAMHQTVTAPAEMRDKIVECTSYDGPGFSDEYIRRYKNEIEKMGNKITHCEYGPAGPLLFILPGAKKRVLESSIDGESLSKIGDRHMTENLVMDNKTGMVIEGEENSIMKNMGAISRAAEGDGMALLEYYLADLNVATIGAKVVTTYLFLKAVVLIITIAEAFRLAIHISNAVGTWFEDIKYSLFKPSVSGVYEMNLSNIEAIYDDTSSSLKTVLTNLTEAKQVINNMRYQWSGLTFYRSKIRSNIRSIENDLDKLSKLNNMMKNAATIYRNADNASKEIFIFGR